MQTPNPHGFMDKCKNIVTKLKTRKKIAKAIEELKIQVKEVGERNSRYKNPGTIKNTSNMTVDPRALTIFEDASNMLVGIDEPKAELIKLLERKGCESSQKTKVVSIIILLDPEDLEKTTLANQVYQELFPAKEKLHQQVKDPFDCGALLSVSRSPDRSHMEIPKLVVYSNSSEKSENFLRTKGTKLYKGINYSPLVYVPFDRV
ncbi:hypothetical protein BAE44_0020395 [Dichanthelium oligosanthes]|uniref:Uncharacterized protein n=1 Tax=Dichanthelium oligosanthes TaxID=888268 RepID=A0A1E5V0G0_9POAL|nr:hypothetical protein BAE44_0020395 [Dichanthelium oligosanthes]